MQLLPGTRRVGGFYPLAVLIRGQPALGERRIEQASGGVAVDVRGPYLHPA